MKTDERDKAANLNKVTLVLLISGSDHSVNFSSNSNLLVILVGDIPLAESGLALSVLNEDEADHLWEEMGEWRYESVARSLDGG